jgi:formylmethanofuran dehydrogenase subunit B
MTASRTVEQVTCLGCGCACDDLSVRVNGGRIAEIAPPCPLGQSWFGDGIVPDKILRGGAPASLDEAIGGAADLLTAASGKVLVYVGTDLTTQAHRVVLAIADLLGAVVDQATSDPAAAGLLAAQRRGRATATLGEIRNRADTLLFWGIDPSVRYPRYLSRYALEPVGTHVPGGRRGRTVIAVSVGADRGPGEADLQLALDPDDEIAALSVMRATVLGNPLAELPERLRAVPGVAQRLAQARYAVLVHEAEPGDERRNPHRAEGLIALTQALNGPTRAALSSLRAGGNRSGIESVLTWQTGYPMAVDYSEGFPSYAPSSRGLLQVSEGGFGAALLAGSIAGLATADTQPLARVPTVVIGPRASEASLGSRFTIDTGVAGIHEAGTAYRMDEVPLPLRPPLSGPRSATASLSALLAAVRAQRAVRQA